MKSVCDCPLVCDWTSLCDCPSVCDWPSPWDYPSDYDWPSLCDYPSFCDWSSICDCPFSWPISVPCRHCLQCIGRWLNSTLALCLFLAIACYCVNSVRQWSSSLHILHCIYIYMWLIRFRWYSAKLRLYGLVSHHLFRAIQSPSCSLTNHFTESKYISPCSWITLLVDRSIHVCVQTSATWPSAESPSRPMLHAHQLSAIIQ